MPAPLANHRRDVEIETVVNFGSVAEHQGCFESLLAEITNSPQRRLLIVPGGGPFADTVREVDRQLGLSNEAAHWMAVLAMDQVAYLIVSKLPGSIVVTDRHEIAAAFDGRRIPVLAPFRWLSRADPLPHTWAVTSDTIAAWVSGQLGARRLLLVKPPGASGPNLVDEYFARSVPAGIEPVILPADRLDALRMALSAPYRPNPAVLQS
jgi:aspartokinase-like uncharacterized kinase